MEILSETHRIISAMPEDMKKDKQGPRIGYLGDVDVIVIAGWKENTGMMSELITNYLELTSDQHKRAIQVPIIEGLSGMVAEIWRVLEEIYQIRKEKAGRVIRIDEIKIYPCFAAHPPKSEKVAQKEWQYAKSGLAEADIVLDSNNYLIDGYIWYLLAKSYGLTHVYARYGRRQVIRASHKHQNF